jgi:hypothetical protein
MMDAFSHDTDQLITHGDVRCKREEGRSPKTKLTPDVPFFYHDIASIVLLSVGQLSTLHLLLDDENDTKRRTINSQKGCH